MENFRHWINFDRNFNLILHPQFVKTNKCKNLFICSARCADDGNIICLCMLLPLHVPYVSTHQLFFSKNSIFKYKVSYESPSERARNGERRRRIHKHTSCEWVFARNDIRHWNIKLYKNCVLPWGEMCLRMNIKIAFSGCRGVGEGRKRFKSNFSSFADEKSKWNVHITMSFCRVFPRELIKCQFISQSQSYDKSENEFLKRSG